MPESTGANCCATGGYYAYYIHSTSLYNTNRGSAGDNQTKLSRWKYMEDAPAVEQ